jgi:hypothetical protein
MDVNSRAFWQELNDRAESGARLTIDLTPADAFRLHHLLKLALRDGDIRGLGRSIELAADIRQRIHRWLAETPCGADAMAESEVWDRKYEPSFK